MCFFSTNAVVISESVRCRFIVTMDESRIAVRNISLSISSSDTETRTQEAHFLTDVRIRIDVQRAEWGRVSRGIVSVTQDSTLMSGCFTSHCQWLPAQCRKVEWHEEIVIIKTKNTKRHYSLFRIINLANEQNGP